MITVIDDFLPKDVFENMQTFMQSPEFPWYYLSHVSRPAGSFIPAGAVETFGWHHNFYSKLDNVKSYSLDGVLPLLQKLEEYEDFKIEFIRVRAGMKTYKKGFTADNYNVPHVDYHFPHKSVVFYMNETDGDTFIFDKVFNEFPEPIDFGIKERVSPKPNRLLILDGLCYHTASNPINSDNRIIININYVDKK